MSHRTNVLEYSSPKVVLSDPNGIKGVKIIGVDSINGYKYRIDALKKAKPLYENAAVFIDHGNPREKKRGSRQLRDHFGTLQAVRERHNGNGIYGDLHVKMSHPMAKAVIEAADKGKFGLSHNAFVLMNDDETEVIEILEVNSVDLVDDPATTKNLFEEETMSQEFQDKLMARFDKIDARFDKIEAKPVTEEVKPPPKKRIEAFEEVKPGEGEPEPIGNTHEDFLAEVRGFSVV